MKTFIFGKTKSTLIHQRIIDYNIKVRLNYSLKINKIFNYSFKSLVRNNVIAALYTI